MKKFFIATALLILFAAQICYAAPQSLDRATANSRARQLFEINSAEGVWHSVYIVGENEKLLHDWIWAPGDRIWTGNYFAYVGQKNSSTFALQNVELFGSYGHVGDVYQRINVTRSNRDGFIRVKGVRGLPDLLVSKIQVTGGGYFEMKVFAVKNGHLQLVRFLDDDKKTLHDTFNTVGSPMTYLDNGTLAVPWHTNAMPGAGSYETVYMFDVENLILIPAYTNKLSSPR